MKKILFLLFILIIPLRIYGLTYPSVNSKIVEIYDLNDNEVLYEIDSNKKTYIASLTKIATVMTAIENINDLNHKVTITSKIMNTVNPAASVAGLKVGDKVTYRDLLYAAMLPSGSDAVNAIAIASSGSISNFVNKMNTLVKKIGLTNTHFANVTGLDDANNYSTASDIRKLLIYSLKNETFKKIYTSKNYTLSNGLKVESTINIYNQYSKLDDSEILGCKTGYTKNAGYCMAALADINGHEVLVILIKAKHEGTKYYNIIDTINLIKFLNKNYKEEKIINKNDLIKVIPVKLSNIDNYVVQATSDITKFLPSDYNRDNIRFEYVGKEDLDFRNKEGEKIGRVDYYYEDELVGQEDVFINRNIKVSFRKVIKEYYYIMIILIIILLLVFIILIKKLKRKNRQTKSYKNISYEVEII